MLKDCRVQAMLPMADMDRARAFYADKLGLTPSLELPLGLQYECGNGTGFGLSSMSLKAAGHTQMAFVTDDLVAEMRELRSRGVVFADYESMNTVDGIADLGYLKAAWFKDSEGNTIGILQLVAVR